MNQSTLTGRRDITMFVLMYNTAARINEILSLKLKDIHLETQKPYIVIVGKGNKLRSLYLLPKTVKYLRKYILEIIMWTIMKMIICFIQKLKENK